MSCGLWGDGVMSSDLCWLKRRQACNSASSKSRVTMDGKEEAITTIQRRVARVVLPAARDGPDGKDGKGLKRFRMSPGR
jgi:hypothetical protein